MTSVLGTRRASVCPAPAHADRPHPEDAEVLLPTTIPPTLPSKSDAVWRIGKYVFRADFDSANLDSVEQGGGPNEFLLLTRRDCGGTENEKATRTWFYFSVHGHSSGDLVILTILNLNKQSRLYSQDYRPFFWCASQPEWEPLRLRVTYRREDEDFQLRFCHRFESEEETLFAFAIPFSYQQTQEMLDHLDQNLPFGTYGTITSEPASTHPSPTEGALGGSPCSPTAAAATDAGVAQSGHAAPSAPSSDAPPPALDRGPVARPGPSGQTSSRNSSTSSTSVAFEALPCNAGGISSPDGRIYYRRQLLTRSLQGRRVDLITITDCCGATAETEPPIPGVFEHNPGPPTAMFRDKTVFFISSRVHPGETPATHMFNGMLAFLLRRTDPRAAALRRRFIFKLVPLVNPDGVAVGNYRTDTLGQNLNRFYTGVPDRATQPSVYAIKSLLMLYAQRNLLEYYIDLHAHANKKGVFIYGNTLEDGEAHLQSLLYAKLVALNNASFDFIGCNYTEKNMSRPDKDGVSKEGAGRVALYRETGLTHLYTIEANYNSARTLNVVPPATGDHGGRASPPCNKRFPPKFTVGAFHCVGRAILVAALDMENLNPWSRLPHSEHRNLEGARSWILTVLRATSETRAAHLPSMSDATVEQLRGMISSGALRVSSGLVSSSGRTRHRVATPQGGEPLPSTSSPVAVAFGRTVGNTAHSIGRRLPQPLPAPPRRMNASLPVIQSGMHASPSANALATSAITGRRSGAGASSGGASVDGLARSTSLPVRSTTPLAARLMSPRTPTGFPPGTREAGSESATASEVGVEDAEAPDAEGAVDLPPASAEGPSDSDGDDVVEDIPPHIASPAPTNPPAATAAPARFRSMEAPLRSPPIPPPPPYKGASVYCGRVTEFKFPLGDRASGVHDTVTAATDIGFRGSLAPQGPGQVVGPPRSRPPSANAFWRPPSSGGTAGITSATAAPPAASAGVAASNGAGSVGAAPLVASVASARHIVLPRTIGSGAAVLMTSEQLSAGTVGVTGASRGKSTLSFARSSSANRRNR